MAQVLMDENNNNLILGHSVTDSYSSTGFPNGTVELYTVMSEDVGTIYTNPLEPYNINTVDKTCDLRNSAPPSYVKLSLTDMLDVALPDTPPVDGIPEVPADGTTQCKLKIEKYSGANNPLTGASHNNTLTVWAAGAGGIDNDTPALINGVATVIITAAAQLGISNIIVTDVSTESLAVATTQLQFK